MSTCRQLFRKECIYAYTNSHPCTGVVVAVQPSVVFVRLTRKLANVMDGVDVTRVRPGDLLNLPDDQADVLIAEGWAEAIVDRSPDQPRSPRPKQSD